MGRKKPRQPKFESEFDEEAESTTALIVPVSGQEDLLYLDDGMDANQVIAVLQPPDLTRCQCEWLDTSVPTFGPKPMVRCDFEPTVIAFQKRATDDDAPTGAMSLCDRHKVMIEHMFPGHCYFRRITTDKQIGDFA